MKKYIIINGSPGTGKTTVGRKIAEAIGRCAYIDGDFVIELHPHVDYKETYHMQKDNILHMSKNYFDFAYCDTVVLSWIMGESLTTGFIADITAMGYDVQHYILTCSKAVLEDRWYKDSVADWRSDEFLAFSTELLEHFSKRKDGNIVDTSSLSIDEAVIHIKNNSAVISAISQ
ncbi:MAG: zeta toxin family protein [Defluviitaleaceae bacterium]|nr:zeta toxin family protein [Defluviitaleaceae bacterium]